MQHFSCQDLLLSKKLCQLLLSHSHCFKSRILQGISPRFFLTLQHAHQIDHLKAMMHGTQRWVLVSKKAPGSNPCWTQVPSPGMGNAYTNRDHATFHARAHMFYSKGVTNQLVQTLSPRSLDYKARHRPLTFEKDIMIFI